MITDHLLDLGHRNFGIVMSAPRRNDRQRARLAGVRAALAAQGAPLSDSRVVDAPISITGGRMACAALYSLVCPPTAFIGLIDIQAIGALIEARARGSRVPEDLSVTEIDTLEIAEHTSPALTTIGLPYGQMGHLAAERVLDLLGKLDAPRAPLHDIDLVERGSAGPPRASKGGAASGLGPA